MLIGLHRTGEVGVLVAREDFVELVPFFNRVIRKVLNHYGGFLFVDNRPNLADEILRVDEVHGEDGFVLPRHGVWTEEDKVRSQKVKNSS